MARAPVYKALAAKYAGATLPKKPEPDYKALRDEYLKHAEAGEYTKPREQRSDAANAVVDTLKKHKIGSLTTLERKIRQAEEVGPRGGHYYVSPSGEKVYTK